VVVTYWESAIRVVHTCPTVAGTGNTLDNAVKDVDMPNVAEVGIQEDVANVEHYTLLLAAVQDYSKMSSCQRDEIRVVNLLPLFRWNCSVKSIAAFL
jgi:hypothetical protein